MYDGYEQKDEVVQLYLDDIIPNRFQPREVFDERALKELAVSIKEHGVIQPIIVRNVNGKYEIIAGERRYKASAMAGLTKIPAIIRNLDDKESSKVALLENLQRKNLNPIEEARTYQKILELDQMTQEDLAKTMGKSQSAVANKLRLLSLPEEIQAATLKEEISERHARALLNVQDTRIQQELLKKIIDTKMSVRALEDEIRIMYPKAKDANEININNEVTPNMNGFLDSTPLIPTAQNVQEESSNYGKVIIAPPIETTPPKQVEEVDDEGDSESAPIGGVTVDINSVRENSKDINSASIGSALDNLLNIQQKPEISKPVGDEYFSTPKVSEINSIPDIKLNTESNGQPQETIGIENSNNYTIDEATDKIRLLIEDLRNHGININADEMNFPKSYQVIIKINKAE